MFGDERMDETLRRTSKMIDVGRVCMKIAGRDAGNLAVVVEKIDDNYVLIDGNVRRKKCNVKHLEPMATVVDIKAKSDHVEVAEAMKKAGLKVVEKQKKTKEAKVKETKKSEEPAKGAKKKPASKKVAKK